MKYKYVYKDNKNGGKLIIEVIADNILAADAIYKKKTGKDVEKQSWVGCSIEPIAENT